MSCTSIFRVKADGDVQKVAEFKNAFGSVMFIWDSLRKEYIPEETMPVVIPGVVEKVWALFNSERLKECEQYALITTFDWFIANLEYLPKIASAFREFKSLHHKEEHLSCTLAEQADTLDDIFNTEKDILGVCWQQTSVSDMWDAVTDNEDDDCRDFNIYKDDAEKQIWYLAEAMVEGK